MKNTFWPTALIAVALFFSACKKEVNGLGSQLIVSDQLELLSFDDQPIKISVVKEDSLTTLNRPTVFVGSINDPDFGGTTASFYTELRMPSSEVTFGTMPQADSMILSLELDEYYGDTLSPLSISVMQMQEPIETTTTDSLNAQSSVNIYSNEDFDFDPQALGSFEFFFQNLESTGLKITLSNSFAQSFLDADPSNFSDNDAFQRFINGLYVTAVNATDKGLLLELDLLSVNSKLSLYYHNNEADSLSYDFQINSSADRMTHWAHDYSSTEIEEAINSEDLSRGYVQGSVGLRTYINLPELSSLKDSNYVFHSAELSIPYIISETATIFSSPTQLGLAAVNSEGNLELLTEDQNTQGNRNELAQIYTFNIARYIHKVVDEGYTNRLALYVPYSVSQPERVIINNYSEDSLGVRLKLFVSH